MFAALFDASGRRMPIDRLAIVASALPNPTQVFAAGANVAFWIYNQNQDGSTYGDGQFTAGTAASLTPAFPPVAIGPIPAVASTTTIEAKSGYGLDLATELRLVEVADELGKEGPVQVVPTWLGAHAVPPEFRAQ